MTMILQRTGSNGTQDLRFTMLQLYEQVLRETQLGEYYRGGDATLGSVSLDDPELRTVRRPREFWRGAYWWNPVETGSSTFREVANYVPAEGKVEWQVPAAGTLSAGYFLMRWPHPLQFMHIIADTLREDVWLPTMTATSFVKDFDMEAMESLTATYWNAPGATAEKYQDFTIHGQQSLHVLDASGGFGYAEPDGGFAVVGGKGYHLSVLARAAEVASPVTLRVVDDDTSTVIAEKSWSGTTWGRIFIDLQLPADTTAISIRLVPSDSSSGYFKDLIFYPYGVNSVPLPGWIREEAQVKAVFKLTPQQFADPDIWLPQYDGVREQDWAPFIDRFSDHEQAVLLSKTRVLQDPLYAYVKRPASVDGYTMNGRSWSTSEQVLSYSTQLSSNRDWTAAAVKLRLYAMMNSWPGAAAFDKDWIKGQVDLAQRVVNESRAQAARQFQLLEEAPSRPRMVRRNFYGSF